MKIKASAYSIQKIKVGEKHTSASIGSGELPVLDLSVLTALMEKAAHKAVAETLDPAQTTVMRKIEIKMTRQIPVSANIMACASMSKREDNVLYFEIEAFDDNGKFAEAGYVLEAVDFSTVVKDLYGEDGR